MSTLSQTTPTESDMLVRGMLDKMLAFQSCCWRNRMRSDPCPSANSPPSPRENLNF